MGNIIGESFKPYVKSQIKIRQQKIGTLQKNNDILVYENNKTSWLRLTSGINVTEEKCKELGLDPESFKGNLLAKNYILFNSVTSIPDNDSPQLKGGLNTSYNNLNSSKAYGFNSGVDYGLVPPPGIISANITPKNRGSLRIAEINLKCFSRQQFTIIETLFLRLKYTLLLEWGHSIYFNNDGNLVTNPINKVYLDFLNLSTPPPPPALPGVVLPPPENRSNQDIILKRIEFARYSHSGNYDGFLGWVTNFSWTLNPSNEYEINIKAVSYGDIIESLSITSPTYQKNYDGNSNNTNKANTSPFGRALNEFKKYLDFPPDNVEIGKVKDKNFAGLSNLTNDDIKSIIKFNSVSYNEPGPITFFREVFKIDAKWYQAGSDNYYIKLGFLLKLIQNFFYKYDTTYSSSPPINFFDYDPSNSFCNITPSLFSADPRVCLIPSIIKGNYTEVDYGKDGDSRSSTTPIDLEELGNTVLGNGFLIKNKETGLMVGNTLNIHLNIDMLLDVLDKNIDEEGNLAILDFIKAVLSNVNKALLGVTSLDLKYDEPTNTYSIIDANLINSIELGSDPTPAQLNIGILQPNNGSFVLEASIQSEISNKLSTQLAIGAQANNSEIGSDSVAISRWNVGLVDRIVTSKVNSSFNINDSGSLNPANNFPFNKFFELLKKYIEFTIEEPELNELYPLARDYVVTEKNYRIAKDELSSNFFLPISLNLVLDGISGPTIFQKYTINDIILPKNYQDNIEFIIKGISHTIDSNGWTTSLDSLSVPKPKQLKPYTPSETPQTQPAQSSSSTKTKYPEKPVVSVIRTEASFSSVKSYLLNNYGETVAKTILAIIIAESTKDENKKIFKALGNNYAGVQTDSGRWKSETDYLIAGRFEARDKNGIREFAYFNTLKDFLDFMYITNNKPRSKGQPKFSSYTASPTPDNWVTSYIQKWWSPGNKNTYTKGTQVYNDKLAIYNTAIRIYNSI
jgi:hypothetical protein